MSGYYDGPDNWMKVFGRIYQARYLAGIVVSAIVKLDDLINFLDIMFGMMAVPTILSTLLLSPRVMAKAREYFAALGQSR